MNHRIFERKWRPWDVFPSGTPGRVSVPKNHRRGSSCDCLSSELGFFPPLCLLDCLGSRPFLFRGLSRSWLCHWTLSFLFCLSGEPFLLHFLSFFLCGFWSTTWGNSLVSFVGWIEDGGNGGGSWSCVVIFLAAREGLCAVCLW